MNKVVAVNGTLLLIALIWGAGFVPQKLGMEYLGPAAFNALRFALGALTLIPVMLCLRVVTMDNVIDRETVHLGLILGFILFAAALAQQVGLKYTSVANVSFITGLYVVMVPVIGFFLGLRYGWVVWFGGMLAMLGLYMMTGLGAAESVASSLKGDLIALLGAVLWAVHLLVIAARASRHQQIVLSFYQFGFCALFSLLLAHYWEGQILPTQLEGYLWPVINGVLVVGVAYTLQVLVMEYAEPFTAAIILSLEAVFGAIAGYLVFDERQGLMALLGAALMLIGCVLAQMQAGQQQEQAGNDLKAGNDFK